MSEARSALPNAKFDGIAHVEDAGLRGMISFRGDLSASKVKAALKAVSGVEMPSQRGCNVTGESGLAWMSPDEILVMVPHAEAAAAVEKLSKALKGQHFMAENVSDARAVFTVAGKHAREVIGKLAPVDMGTFQTGEIRRTRIAQVAAAFWMHGPDAFTVVCFRSGAQYMFDVLSVAAQSGSEVGVY
ncbi:sarcosine oxidase subunit gamma [Lentibacter sp. XHP0401]|jgi:sarcosine oxidase, subunit gamma|uniref:sarcosine oxidase subunit gamma n=1 Tax=Lentibacter sp. XHP0401 TaxID=2984334 RepID=UPI0021E91DBD|nr:sarcosine oxidase subunit gamma family protein [Lentibacter sp. XHP0401]MCV2893993.1 sarcosine oxidase subunit gamma family protein [Lentibacter sp. XHP0401]